MFVVVLFLYMKLNATRLHASYGDTDQLVGHKFAGFDYKERENLSLRIAVVNIDKEIFGLKGDVPNLVHKTLLESEGR